DAPAGIRAGNAAGARVLALRTTAPDQELTQSGATWIINDLASLSLDSADHHLDLDLILAEPEPASRPSSPRRIRQNHRCFHLAFRNIPILFQQNVLRLRTDHLKAVFLVKTDRPRRISPRADQHRTVRQLPQMG